MFTITSYAYKEVMLSMTCMLLFMVVGVTFVNAQEGLAVKVQPSTIEEIVEPGQVLEDVLTVTNKNGGKQTYYISTRNVLGMSDTGSPEFSDETSSDSLEIASWIRPGKDSVTIDVGESVEIPYRIEVPENVSPGSYFGAFFVTREADIATESGAGVGFHVASLVNLRVSGVVKEDMLLREFFTEKTFFSEPSVYFQTRIENTGTIHQRPRGIISIIDMFGNDVGRATFNDNAGAILPQTDRVFDVTWNYNKFALGKYTAIASVVYGESQKKTISKEISFWIVPLKEVGIAVGSIVFILVVFIFGVRRYVQNVLRKAGQSTLPKVKTRNITFAKKLVRTFIWLIAFLFILFIGMIVFFSS